MRCFPCAQIRLGSNDTGTETVGAVRGKTPPVGLRSNDGLRLRTGLRMRKGPLTWTAGWCCSSRFRREEIFQCSTELWNNTRVAVDRTDLYDVVAGTGKALAHGKRLEMLELLAQGERPVRELSRTVGLKLTTASAHLQVLHEAGLVTTRRQGTSVLYRLAGDDVAGLLSVLCRVADAHRSELGAVRRAYLDTENIRLVGREELLQAASEGRALVLDVRPAEEYAAGHVPGAVSIPLDQLADRLAEIPADSEIVAYCRGRYCVLSYDAVRLLQDSGRDAALLEDGIVEWRRDGLPLTAA